MSKKKSRTKAQVPAPLPEVTAEDIQKAKAFLAGLREDVSYTQAKKKLKRELGFASEVANALIVRLNEEGFEKGDEKNWFLNPDAETTTGVVQGARTLDKMTVMPQCDAGEEIPLPAYRPNYIPGDVFELRRSISGWRLSKFIRRPQKRWVCQFLTKSGEYVYLKAVSAFAPLEFTVPASEIPPDVNLKKDAVEVELLPDSETPGEAVNYEERVELNARFVKVVGAMNDPLGEMAIASAQFGVPIEFSPETLEEAKKLPDVVDRRSLQNRVDLTDLPFVTIDGEDARDFDDAVYCADLPGGGWRLLVAIADVSRYVKPGTSLDRDAQIRATSVYFPASVVPMLPEKLSNGLCSLNPGVDRLVMVCDAIVSPEGRTTAYQFYPGVIHSHARLTYNVVWSALQKEPAGLEAIGERLPEIERLHALFKALKAERIARGALDFETEESQAVFNGKGQIESFSVREHNDAHRMIEEAMLVANVSAAKFVLEKKQLTLFRVHDKPDPKKLQELKSLLASFGIAFKSSNERETLAHALSKVIEETKDRPYIQSAILRTMQRACYQPDNIGHFGLQFDAYAHFTSPIRRYPDLLLHRTIKGILSHRAYVPVVEFDDAEVMSGYHARKLGARPDEKAAAPAKPLSRTEARKRVWSRLGIICSSAERRADDATRDVMKYLKCEFLRSKVGRKFNAVVTGMCPAGVFITLEAMPIEGFIHISELGWGYYEYDENAKKMTSYDEMTEVRLGDRLSVRLNSVELEERRINFSLVSSYSRHTVKGRKRGSRGRRRFNYDGFGFFPEDDVDFDDDDDFVDEDVPF